MCCRIPNSQSKKIRNTTIDWTLPYFVNYWHHIRVYQVSNVTRSCYWHFINCHSLTAWILWCDMRIYCAYIHFAECHPYIWLNVESIDCYEWVTLSEWLDSNDLKLWSIWMLTFNQIYWTFHSIKNIRNIRYETGGLYTESNALKRIMNNVYFTHGSKAIVLPFRINRPYPCGRIISNTVLLVCNVAIKPSLYLKYGNASALYTI